MEVKATINNDPISGLKVNPSIYLSVTDLSDGLMLNERKAPAKKKRFTESAAKVIKIERLRWLNIFIFSRICHCDCPQRR